MWLWGVKNLSVKLESGFPLCYPLGKGILAKWDFIDWVSLICQRHTDGTLIVQKFPPVHPQTRLTKVKPIWISVGGWLDCSLTNKLVLNEANKYKKKSLSLDTEWEGITNIFNYVLEAALCTSYLMLYPFVVGKSNAVWGVQIMENAEAVASENKNQTNI